MESSGSFSALMREVAAAPEVPLEEASGLVGTSLGRYHLSARLGEGGMGVVYLAEDTSLNRAVAVKVLSAEVAQDEGSRERLLREARSAAALTHPSIATLYDVSVDGPRPHLVMEYVPGHTLRSHLRRGALPWRQALRVARTIAAGLAHAHKCGIVHRDLKPDNIIITETGEPKILDFGLAKPAASSAPGPMAGTRRYLSPEQAGGGNVDPRSDVFSFGVMLHEMLTGTLPASQWGGEHPLPITIPLAVGHVMRRCLVIRPWERFEDGNALLRALDGCLEHAEQRDRWLRPSVWKPVLLAVLIAFVAGSCSTLVTLGWIKSKMHREPTLQTGR